MPDPAISRGSSVFLIKISLPIRHAHSPHGRQCEYIVSQFSRRIYSSALKAGVATTTSAFAFTEATYVISDIQPIYLLASPVSTMGLVCRPSRVHGSVSAWSTTWPSRRC